MRGKIVDFNIQDRGQSAQALRTYPQSVNFLEDLQAQPFCGGLRASCPELVDVDVLHQRLFRQQHRFFARAADADAKHSGGTPARTHGGHDIQHPVHQTGGGIEYGKFGLVFRAASLGGDTNAKPISGYRTGVDHCRSVVSGVLSRTCRVSDHGGAQHIVGMTVSSAYPFVYHLFHAELRLPLQMHADIDKSHHHAGVLAYRPVSFGAHAGVDQYLGNRIFSRR